MKLQTRNFKLQFAVFHEKTGLYCFLDHVFPGFMGILREIDARKALWEEQK